MPELPSGTKTEASARLQFKAELFANGQMGGQAVFLCVAMLGVNVRSCRVEVGTSLSPRPQSKSGGAVPSRWPSEGSCRGRGYPLRLMSLAPGPTTIQTVVGARL